MVGGGQGAFIGNVHRIAARLDDHYTLVAGALASTPERAYESGRRLRLARERTYASYEEMALEESKRDDRIDVVSIVTPNYLHYPVAKLFLDAGIHVICDKPLTTSLADAKDLQQAVAASGRIFTVTYNYSGYPMVRMAREMVAGGCIGSLRVVQVEYCQGWMAEKVEDSGSKQVLWRSDPEKSGPGGCIGDIGTHAFHLSHFICNERAVELSAELSTFVSGRRVDDNAHILLRFENGAKGMLWASQVAVGEENGLRIRIYGDGGSLIWTQENPNYLLYSQRGKPQQRLSRGGPETAAPGTAHSGLPAGHPEGYLEAFAQIYTDTARLIHAHRESRKPVSSAQLAPGVLDGIRGVEFIEAAIQSSANAGAWISLKL